MLQLFQAEEFHLWGDPSLVLSSISGLITNLENIDPIGRVVTEFDLDLLERFPEKDLLLEPGDRILFQKDHLQ